MENRFRNNSKKAKGGIYERFLDDNDWSSALHYEDGYCSYRPAKDAVLSPVLRVVLTERARVGWLRACDLAAGSMALAKRI